ncbi:hypothetical protein FACS189481_4550 [Clostridia bacterium]|nr:hypothetical protein FACS189481_4550 [Clostridia bacterium]
MLNLVKGDLGVSLNHSDKRVNDIIKESFPASAKIGSIAAALAVCIGIFLGSLAAYNRGKFWDGLIMFFATLGIAVPNFVIAIALLVILGVKLGKFPTFGLETPVHYILPVLALTFHPTAYIVRLTRSSMLDVLGQDYMRTAKAKGLSQLRSIFKHALRNAMLPVMTYIGSMLAWILMGSFAVEHTFSIPGIGKTLVESVEARDYSLVMGITIFITSYNIVTVKTPYKILLFH